MTVIAELQSISGVPLHPLLVHLPVVFVPLAFIGAIVGLAVKRWRGWCLPLTAVFATLGLLGTQLAIMSGEGLEERWRKGPLAVEAILADECHPAAQPLFDDGLHVRIDLAGHDLGAGLDQRLGQRAGPGADLEDDLARPHARRLDQLAEHVVVVEEVLPEAMLGPDAAPGEQGLDLAQRLHAEERSGPGPLRRSGR